MSLNLVRDIAGNNTFGLNDPDYKYENTLTSVGGEKELTVPGRFPKYLAIFSIEPGAEVWYAKNATATLPAAGEFVATDSELNPVARSVKKGDILHFITGNDDARMGILLYAIQ